MDTKVAGSAIDAVKQKGNLSASGIASSIFAIGWMVAIYTSGDKNALSWDDVKVKRNLYQQMMHYKPRDRAWLQSELAKAKHPEIRMRLGGALAVMYYPELSSAERQDLNKLVAEKAMYGEATRQQELLSSTLNYYRDHASEPKMGWTQRWEREQIDRMTD